MKTRFAALAGALLLTTPPVEAGTLSGVTMSEIATVGGTTLQLNGMGLRELVFVDVYVGGLYLPTRTRSAREAIEADVPKRIVMHFIFRKVSREKMIATFQEGLERNPAGAALNERMQRLFSVVETSHSGDRIVLDYVPGEGLSFIKNGQTRITIEGADFMRAIWSIYLGEEPASEDLKRGMLGG